MRAMPYRPDALFWPARSNGSRRLDFSRNIDCGSVLQYYMRPLLPELGLPPKMRWHDLRHTYASLMLAAAIPPTSSAGGWFTSPSSQRTRSTRTWLAGFSLSSSVMHITPAERRSAGSSCRSRYAAAGMV